MNNTPEIEEFFEKKNGKPVTCPASLTAIADSHTHLNSLLEKGVDVDRAIVRAALAGVDFLVNVIDPVEDVTEIGEFFSQIENWATQIPELAFFVGVHPHNAKEFKGRNAEVVKSLLEHPLCCGIGEIGLDYHYDLSPRQLQKEVFSEELSWAVERNIPVSFHIREAHSDALEIITRVGLPEVGGILHCYTSDVETLKPFLDLGLHVAFGGAVTFGRSDDIRDACCTVPLERLLFETDAPYMSPVPCRGVDCEPAHIALTAAFIADMRGERKGEDRDSVYSAAHENAVNLLLETRKDRNNG